jgi:hypothetical protein
MNRGDIQSRAHGNITVVCLKDKRHVNVLSTLLSRAVEGNFWNAAGNAVKP